MEEKIDQKYIKGFNSGYALAKHEPKLAAQITARPNDHSEYFKGLVAGKGQYNKEMREWAKSFSKGSPAKDERDIDKER